MKAKALTAGMVLALFCPPGQAEVNLNETLSVGGVVSGAWQCSEQDCLGALPVQPEFVFNPADSHELYLKLGFAAGNGLNADSPFSISPWAADLVADIENINGRSRDYVLTAWYKHNARLRGQSTLGVTVGIIDATDYLDGNAYSNDEYSQFMNSALVNGPHVFLPSYDRGVALAWESPNWSASSVYMNVGQNDDGNEFDFLGVQVAYHADTRLGAGNYRLLVDGTNERFLDPTGTTLESRAAVLISCDQQLGDTLGAFVRIGTQSDEASIDYGGIYSGGLDLEGQLWGRPEDNLGIGYAYLTGGNGDLARSQVAEAYYRLATNRHVSITGDVQYMIDDYRTGGGPAGFILGARVTAQF